MGCSTRGFEWKVLVRPNDYATNDPDWNVDTTAEVYRFADPLGLTEVQDQVFVEGTRGYRAPFVDQTVRGNRVAGGPVRLPCTRRNLDRWLPRILGANEATDVFKVATTVPWFQMLIDKGQGKFFEYRDCKVASALFSAGLGGVVYLDMNIVAKQEEEYGSAWPTTSPEPYNSTLATRPLRLQEGQFILDPSGTPIGPTGVYWAQFQLSIDNQIQPDFFAGADTAQCMDEDFRTTMLGIGLAHTTQTKDLYKRGFEGLAGRLKFAADNMNTQFDFPKLFWAKRSPTRETQGRITLPLQMRAYRTDAGNSGADDEIQVTNDPVFAS